METAKKTKKLIMLGEPLEEIRADGSTSVGGDAVNFTVGAKRMDANLKEALKSDTNVDVYLMAAIGGKNDPRSQKIHQFLKENGVKDDLLMRVPNGHAGAYKISLDDKSEHALHYIDRDDAAFRDLFDAHNTHKGEAILDKALGVIDSDTTLVLSGITISRVVNNEKLHSYPEQKDRDSYHHLLDFISTAKKQGAHVVLDVNYRQDLWPDEQTARASIAPFLHLSDTVYMTRPDDSKLWFDPHERRENMANALLHGDLKKLVIKEGAKGCMYFWRDADRQARVTENIKEAKTGTPLSNNEQKFSKRMAQLGTLISDGIAAHNVTPVEKSGAGDTLMAGTELALAHGEDMHTALIIGSRAAAHVVQQHGATLNTDNVPSVEKFREDKEPLNMVEGRGEKGVAVPLKDLKEIQIRTA